MLYDDGRSKCSRFQSLPLRVTQAEVNAVVETPGALQCTHFDAFRFFAPGAKPLNVHTSLSRKQQPRREQPGCVHANMDLIKYALRLSPAIRSELLGEALAVAIEARILDMRASPYDLTGVFPPENGFGIDPSPVAVETQSGRKLYAELQLALAAKAAPVRDELIQAYERYLQVSQ